MIRQLTATFSLHPVEPRAAQGAVLVFAFSQDYCTAKARQRQANREPAKRQAPRNHRGVLAVDPLLERLRGGYINDTPSSPDG